MKSSKGTRSLTNVFSGASAAYPIDIPEIIISSSGIFSTLCTTDPNSHHACWGHVSRPLPLASIITFCINIPTSSQDPYKSSRSIRKKAQLELQKIRSYVTSRLFLQGSHLFLFHKVRRVHNQPLFFWICKVLSV